MGKSRSCDRSAHDALYAVNVHTPTIDPTRMDNRLAVDLKVFRRRSGLSQADVAHLLGVDRSLISKFERGGREPSMEHVCFLCLVYGTRPPAFCVAALPQFRQALAERLYTLPRDVKQDTVKRRMTITRLADDLAGSLDDRGC